MGPHHSMTSRVAQTTSCSPGSSHANQARANLSTTLSALHMYVYMTAQWQPIVHTRPACFWQWYCCRRAGVSVSPLFTAAAQCTLTEPLAPLLSVKPDHLLLLPSCMQE